MTYTPAHFALAVSALQQDGTIWTGEEAQALAQAIADTVAECLEIRARQRHTAEWEQSAEGLALIAEWKRKGIAK